MSLASMTRCGVVVGLSSAALLTSAPVFAHHGWTGYGTDDFSLQGTVQSASLGNPHGVIMIRSADGRAWMVVLGPSPNQRRAGLTEALLPVGAPITAQGHRHLNPNQLEIKTERLLIGEKVFDIYPERLRP